MIKLELEGKIYKEKIIEINNGITVLTGPNGSGKTYACSQICDYLDEQKKKYLNVNVYEEGKHTADSFTLSGDMKSLAKYLNSSEGQRVFDTLVDINTPKMGDYVRKLIQDGVKEGYIIIDGCDSGVSIDLMLSYRSLFEFILDDCKKENIEMYIIITSNSYELVYDYDCIWIPTMEHYKRGGEADGYNLWRKMYNDVYKKRNK
ncbi:ATP-binding protein [uncultured Clostridium sp.]|uniref:ATP-binding protein n=1 Tax=uncultured Clostridium sp. TaxID=59620 RepID=UPI0026EAD2D7|nr:hypothetical protein [uncultured Clostridium sp.]